MSRHRVVIVGAGHAGGRVAQHLVSCGHDGPIVLIGEEPHAPYERPPLSKDILLGAAPETLTLAPAEFWSDTRAPESTDARVQRLRGRVVNADLDSRRVSTDDGLSVDFDSLVIATGCSARTLPGIPRNDARFGVLRTLDDSLALRRRLGEIKHLGIVGGGVIGLEVAAAARQLGVAVTILEAAPSLMGRCLPPAISAWLRTLHASRGVQIETGVSLQGWTRSGERIVLKTVIADGAPATDGAPQTFLVDQVMLSIGVRPDVGWLSSAGIPVGDGIPVDDHCRVTAAPFVYAVGDIALAYNPVYASSLRQETWRNAENQSRAVARIICGDTEPYAEIPWMWTDQYARNIQVVGRPAHEDSFIQEGDPDKGPASLTFHRNGRVTGAVLIDCGRKRRGLEQLIRERGHIRTTSASVVH